MSRRRTLVVSADDSGRRLGEVLAQGLECERAQADAWVRTGAVYVQGKREQNPERVLAATERILVMLSEGGMDVLAPAIVRPEPRVLHEDADVVAVDKPAGWVTQPTPGRVGDSLLDWVLARWGSGVGLVHRLDRETSGVVVFGKNRAATSALAAHFREGRALKHYVAVVGTGVPEAGTIEAPLARDPSHPGRFRATQKGHGVAALTRFHRVFDTGIHAGVELWPETGRTHQLRAHLTSVGFPIAGDRRYGGARTLGDVSISRTLLHAAQLSLPPGPNPEPLTLQSPMPEDMSLLWRPP